MKLRNMIQTATIILTLVLWSGSSSLPQERKQEAPQETSSLKLSADLISLNVTVTDQQGQAITGLKREDFKVYENGVEQTVSSFSDEDSAVSWGLVLDRSNMSQKIMDDIYHAAFHVVYERADRDEAFIVIFTDKVEKVSGFTSNYGQLLSALRRIRPGRHTALYDAVVFALDQMKQGRNRKKALFVVTESGDDSSKTTFQQLIERAKREDTLIYTVGLAGSLSLSPHVDKDGDWRHKLNELAEVTGARAHFPDDLPECEEMMKAIVAGISRQYRIEYRPSNPSYDGGWRNIRVVVEHRDNKPGYFVRTRAGYYAPRR